MPGIMPLPPPPFVKMPGIPGVIYDGNTVAWFDHQDMRTIIQDGANRVSYWLDKINLNYVNNILPAPLDFTAWNPLGTAVIDNDYSFHNGIGAGLIRINAYTLTVNTTYRIRARLNVPAGHAFRIYDFNTANIQYTYTGIGVFETIEDYFTCTAVVGAGINFYLNNNNSSVIFDYCIIEPVTGNHLIQNTGANQPLYSFANGLLFDGVTEYMKTLPFVYNQPEQIYIVFRALGWFNQDSIFDGNASSSFWLSQSNGGAPPDLRFWAAAYSPTDAGLPLNTYGIITCLANGAASEFRINRLLPWIGNAGGLNASGFTLGARGGAGLYGNIEAKEILLRNVVDNAATQLEIYNYLQNKHAI